MECWAAEELLPAEVWALVCARLATADLVRMSVTCWTLRSHALTKVSHHSATPLGLVTPRSGMKKVLAFLATLPSLASLELSAWDSFSDSLVPHLPGTLKTVGLSYTSITDRGLTRLPVGLTSLDVGFTQVTTAGLRHLSRLRSLRELDLSSIGRQRLSTLHLSWLARLTSLRKLNLSSFANVSLHLLQFVPPTVEVLNLSFCTGDFSSGRLANWGDTLQRPPWPPGLKELVLQGARIALAQLCGMPPTLTSLDLYRCQLDPFLVDLDVHLPQLTRLRIDEASFPYYSSDFPWNLRVCLKSQALSSRHPLFGAPNTEDFARDCEQLRQRIVWRDLAPLGSATKDGRKQEEEEEEEEEEDEEIASEDEDDDEEDEQGSLLFIGP